MERIELKPNPGPQTTFLSCGADIVLYGGAAGGGKTWALLADPLRHLNVKGFRAVTFRRTRPEIMRAGSLWDASMDLYPQLGGDERISTTSWLWPGNYRHEFSGIELDQDLESWRGAQIAQIQFDELTTFTKRQFLFLFSRTRSVTGLRSTFRMTCNPDPDSWVLDLVRDDLDKDGYPDHKKAGRIRWMVVDNGVFVFDLNREVLKRRYPKKDPKSFCFIPSRLSDTPQLADGDYRSNLQAMEEHDRLRLEDGNWFARRRGGLYDRSMFPVVDMIPSRAVHTARFWDFAATKAEGAKDPDFTASVKVSSLANGFYLVHDAFEDRWEPEQSEAAFIATAKADGREVKLRWEQEPGSAGKMVAASLTKMVRGWDAQGIPSTGSKLERGKPALAQARKNNVLLMRGTWNENFLQRVESFGGPDHDDMADAFHGAFNDCMSNTKELPVETVLANPGGRVRRGSYQE